LTVRESKTAQSIAHGASAFGTAEPLAASFGITVKGAICLAGSAEDPIGLHPLE
jgi:hypothetical protein